MLSLRPHSELEILTRLRGKTQDESVVLETMQKLRKSNYLDDEKFAVWMVESYSRSKPKGKSLLIRELKQKGISAEIIEKVMSENTDDQSAALLLLSKKQNSLRNLSDREYKLKASRILYSRGFSWSTIETVLKKRYN
jgi:regulatory protein